MARILAPSCRIRLDALRSSITRGRALRTRHWLYYQQTHATRHS